MIFAKPTAEELKLYDVLSTPLQKNAGLYINVARYFTDINGTVIAKTNPLVTDAGFNKKFPIWMFGEFDRLGGYHAANEINPPSIGYFLGSFVYGLDIPFLFATGLNTVKNNFALGDVVHVFTDSLDIPSVYCWIVQTYPAGSLASVYANAIASEKHKINIEGCNYFAYTNSQPNLQFIQNIILTRLDVVGAYNHEGIDPLSSRMTSDKQDFIYFPIKFTVDQYNLVTSYIDFAIDSVQFSFLIKKNTDKV